MKTWHRLVVLVIGGIVVVGIVLFVCDSFSHPFFSGGKYKTVNQYEVFRDLLAIVLTLAGLTIALLGMGVYKWISKGLDTKVEGCLKDLDTKVKESLAGLDVRVKKRVDEEVNYAMCTFYLELSYDYWRVYEKKGEFQPNKRNELEIAIEQSKKALRRAEGLDKKQRSFESILCVAKNNLAYHLAARNRTEDAEKAISLAKYAYDRAQDFDFEDSCSWIETYAFVLIRMGGKEQKKEGQRIVRELRDRRYLPKSLRDSVDRKYTKKLTLRSNWN